MEFNNIDRERLNFDKAYYKRHIASNGADTYWRYFSRLSDVGRAKLLAVDLDHAEFCLEFYEDTWLSLKKYLPVDERDKFKKVFKGLFGRD